MSRVRYEPPKRSQPKKKRVTEGTPDEKYARISFKKYLQEVEEEEALDFEDDLYEDDGE